MAATCRYTGGFQRKVRVVVDLPSPWYAQCPIFSLRCSILCLPGGLQVAGLRILSFNFIFFSLNSHVLRFKPYSKDLKEGERNDLPSLEQLVG